MKVFSDKNSDTVNIVQSIASASTLISSLAGEARQYIISKFPKDFFKHIYIDTSQTKTQQNYNDNYNKTANKIPFPSMTISPEISIDEPIAGMEKSIHLSNPNLYLRRDINRTYDKILIDTEDDFSIYYTSEYITTNFNFRITTNSFIQNADILFFLKSHFQKEFFQFYNNRPLQTEIPKSFIKAIADMKKWNLNDPSDMTALRLYLIGTSKTEDFIQKKVNQNTGKVCFFINKYQNLLTLMTDLDAPGSINRNAQVEDTYTANFRLQVSAWIPSNFILSINKSTLRKLGMETIQALQSDSNQQDEGFYSVAFHLPEKYLSKKNTIQFEDSTGNIQIGQLTYSETFLHKLGEPIPIIYIPEQMNNLEFNVIYNYAINKYNVDPTSLVKICLFNKNGTTLNEGFEIDYSNLSVSLNDEIDSDIAVALYVNRVAYEAIKKSVIGRKKRLQTGYMTDINANLGDTSVKLTVNYFNDDYFFDSVLDRSVRIKTPYGIGYIVLTEPNTDDGYRVCLGYDKDNNPIIKQFEMKT